MAVIVRYDYIASFLSEARFGLYYVDRSSGNLERTLTEGGEVLHNIIEASNGHSTAASNESLELSQARASGNMTGGCMGENAIVKSRAKIMET
jgi:hypothetical protein